jgi:hypothetical protein
VIAPHNYMNQHMQVKRISLVEGGKVVLCADLLPFMGCFGESRFAHRSAPQ